MEPNSASTNCFCTLDQILSQHSVNLLSLNPCKNLTTSFAELGDLIAEKTTDSQLITNLRETLEIIIYAQLENFPENIFWDFDFMVSSMLRQALRENDGAVLFVDTFRKKMVSITELFGKTEIRFRYVHDFIYGFEWARWVNKEPQNRANIEPFSLIFLDYLLCKGQEIIQKISLNQVTTAYKLSETGYRNPFCFSREPEDEYRLLTYLAQKQLIPVAVWNWDTQPIWNKPFHRMREQLSLKLNIPQQTS
ncbi:hypothetical protein Cylst_2186 [Cylindrospermum stagnale PCC 7417]|uniref:Ferrochelatase n=1 Tax=Cylindrospermum stagnale PCC 7417 TaxID=56107 RepID=K9WY28_9NOST|nr:hypothetical protein [Cylindrospermum stagnale]AFZ24422.1 hypothetical protein Cylst_2186 [Cylindrospermum stagnale PCC 7417]